MQFCKFLLVEKFHDEQSLTYLWFCRNFCRCCLVADCAALLINYTSINEHKLIRLQLLRLGFSSITISLDHSAMQLVLFFHMADIFKISYVGEEKRASQIAVFVPLITHCNRPKETIE